MPMYSVSVFLFLSGFRVYVQAALGEGGFIVGSSLEIWGLPRLFGESPALSWNMSETASEGELRDAARYISRS